MNRVPASVPIFSIAGSRRSCPDKTLVGLIESGLVFLGHDFTPDRLTLAASTRDGFVEWCDPGFTNRSGGSGPTPARVLRQAMGHLGERRDPPDRARLRAASRR
jgi:hypothetical protein